jgi:hypothetical protein
MVRHLKSKVGVLRVRSLLHLAQRGGGNAHQNTIEKLTPGCESFLEAIN